MESIFSLKGMVASSTHPISYLDQFKASYNVMLKSESVLLIVQESPTCNAPLEDETFRCDLFSLFELDLVNTFNGFLSWLTNIHKWISNTWKPLLFRE